MVGDTVEIVHRAEWDFTCDIACMVGVKNLDALQEHRARGIPVIYIDKGYDRGVGIWRISFNAHQPTEYLGEWGKNDARLAKFRWRIPTWRKSGAHVLMAGSGMKYHYMKDLGHPTDYAGITVAEIRKYSTRVIKYRPKPSWGEAVPVAGTDFSREKTIYEPLKNAWALITYGSNSCFEAMMTGIPSIVTGDAVTRSISSNCISEIERPRLAGHSEVKQLLCNLSYSQWHYDEFADGSLWDFIKQEIGVHG